MANNLKVLVVDDSATSVHFMSQALRKAGYHVMTASNGHEAVAKAIQERPHCLILDVVLPGMSGFGVCRKIREIDPQHRLPIIMVSSKDTPLDTSWGLRQGADRYLPKPFTEEELLSVVEEVLAERARS